jgi:hypothetical protein
MDRVQQEKNCGNNGPAIGRDSSWRKVLKQIQFNGENIRIVFKNE